MNRLAKILLPVLAVAIIISACKKEEPKIDDPADDMTLVGSGTDNGLEIEVYVEDSVVLGYNELYVRVTEESTGKAETGYTITFAPEMDMGTMQHSSPFENPDSKNDDGFYEGAVVFIMPSTQGTWSLEVNADDGAGNSSSITVNPEVKLQAEPRMLTFVSDIDQAKLFVSLVEPYTPEIGINDFEITIHEKAGMMDFPAVTNYTVDMEPEMPTMGHGSPNNVDPVHDSDGHYKGEVNFTMTGYWKVNLTIMNGADTVQSGIAFDITF